MKKKITITLGKFSASIPLFNPREHLFDGALIIYSHFFLYGFASGDSWLYESFSVWPLVILGGCATFFITWDLGIIFTSFKQRIQNYTFLAALAFFSLWIAGSLQGSIWFDMQYLFSDEKSRSIALIGFGLFFFMGLGYGLIFALTEMAGEKGKSLVYDRVSLVKEGFVFLALPGLMLYVYVSLILEPVVGKIAQLIALGVEVVLFGSLYLLLRWTQRKLKKRKDSGFEKEGKIYTVFKQYCLPVILCFLICVCEEIYIFGKISQASQAGSPLSFSGMVLHLFLVGILPLRFLMALAPPYSAAGTAGGLVSAGYFLYMVKGMLPV